MGVSIKTDLEIGQVMYLKVDPFQEEYQLSALIVVVNKGIRFRLACMGHEIEVWDFEASTVIDQEKLDKLKKDEGKDEDDE